MYGNFHYVTYLVYIALAKGISVSYYFMMLSTEIQNTYSNCKGIVVIMTILSYDQHSTYE